MRRTLSKPTDIRRYLNHVVSVGALIILMPLLIATLPFLKRLASAIYTSTLVLFILGLYLISISIIMNHGSRGKRTS
ncbi:MAG: hypothetical protein RXN84_07005 [Caldivirga sp.]|jgi:hypothetical protein